MAHAEHEEREVGILEAAVRAAPRLLAPYRALADHHARRGDQARALLWLGLGFLRAHGAAAIARAKLMAARELDPELDGLPAALAELHRAG